MNTVPLKTSVAFPNKSLTPKDFGGIHRYRITQKLVGGGMSEVARAVDVLAESRPTVLKYVPATNPNKPHLGDTQIIGGKSLNEEALDREAQILSLNLHPMFPQIYEHGYWENHKFIAMEDIDGITLEALLKRDEEIPLYKSIEIVMQVCYGLAALHDHNSVHRDIKPANILITTTDDNKYLVRLIDFGIACEIGSPVKHVVGTPSYLAPEQIKHQGIIDQRTDIYALGLVLYQILTNHKPVDFYTDYFERFAGNDTKSPEEINSSVSEKSIDEFFEKRALKIEKGKIEKGIAPSLGQEIDAAHETLQQIINGMTAAKQKDRFENMQQVISLLEKARAIALKLAPLESQI
jgi:serine/threonine protein kinase